jgi:hypothetical protein
MSGDGFSGPLERKTVALPLPKLDGASEFEEGWRVGFRRGLERACQILEADLAPETQEFILANEAKGRVVGLLDGRLVAGDLQEDAGDPVILPALGPEQERPEE